MPVESAADRAAFLADFGVEVTINAAVSPNVFTAIFDNAYAEAAFGQGAPIAASAPVLRARTADIGDLDEGVQVTVEGTAYRVAEKPHHDGTGMSEVILEKTS